MLNNINSLISNQLVKIIKERKLKDSDVLRLCGFTRPTLMKIKNEGNINIETLAALANGLKVNVGYFFDEESKPEDAAGYKSDLRETNYDPTDLDNINLPSDCPAHTRFLVEKEICEIRHLKNLIADKERMLDSLLDSVNETTPLY